MKALSVREARGALSHLERLLEQEGEVVITRRGKSVARLVPLERKRPIPSHRALREKMPRLGVGSEALVREDRDGR